MKLKAQIRGVTYGKNLTRRLKKLQFPHTAVFRVPDINTILVF
jgi:hypothetical protein